MAQNVVVVTTEAQLQAALSNAEFQPISCISIQDDIIELTAPLQLPKSLYCRSKQLVIDGNGSTIAPAIGNTLSQLMIRSASTQSEALNTMQSQAFIFKNICFDGRGSGVGLDLAATYGSSIENCKFQALTEGLHLRFCLMTRVVSCLTVGISGIAFVADKGNWTGASNSNSQSNHTRFEQCRVFNSNGAYAAFALYAASGIVIDQCISEGSQPNYHIFFDSQCSSVVKDFTMRNTHLESSATVAGIKLRLSGGYARITGLYSQYDQILIDAEAASGYPHLYVEDVPWLTGGTTFKTLGTAVIWSFNEVWQGDTIFAITRWVGGTIPYYRYSEFFNQSKQIITNSMKVNNKTIS